MFRLLVLASLLVSFVAPSPWQGGGGGNSDCAQWCASNFPHPGSDCTSLAAHGKGPCFECGPGGPPHKDYCGGKCCDKLNDDQNCGKCGNVCCPGSYCQSGSCVCREDKQPPCGNTCCGNGKECCKGSCVPKGTCGKPTCTSTCPPEICTPKISTECVPKPTTECTPRTKTECTPIVKTMCTPTTITKEVCNTNTKQECQTSTKQECNTGTKTHCNTATKTECNKPPCMTTCKKDY
jgi:hypothetical protein